MEAGQSSDQLLDDDGLADTRAAEQAGLAAADQRAEQVDDLDAGLEHLGLGGEVHHFRRFVVDGAAFHHRNRSTSVDDLADQVEHPSERLFRQPGRSPAPVSRIFGPRCTPSMDPAARRGSTRRRGAGRPRTRGSPWSSDREPSAPRPVPGHCRSWAIGPRRNVRRGRTDDLGYRAEIVATHCRLPVS